MSLLRKIIFIGLATCFLAACSQGNRAPLWYSRASSSLLNYGAGELVWLMGQGNADLGATAQGLTLGVFTSNLAGFDGTSEELAASVNAIPAAQIAKIESCLGQINIDSFVSPKEKRTAVRITWPKELPCQVNAISRSNIITVVSHVIFPSMANGTMTAEGLKLLAHSVLRMPPAPVKLKVFDIIDNTGFNIDTSTGTEYLKEIAAAYNFTLIEEPDEETAFLACILKANKLDPTSFHRTIYQLNCQIVTREREILWMDTGYVIPLLP